MDQSKFVETVKLQEKKDIWITVKANLIESLAFFQSMFAFSGTVHQTLTWVDSVIKMKKLLGVLECFGQEACRNEDLAFFRPRV